MAREVWVAEDLTTTTTTATEINKLSLDFTSPSGGTYLVISNCEYQTQASLAQFLLQSGVLHDNNLQPKAATDFSSYPIIQPMVTTSGAVSIPLSVISAVSGGQTQSMRQASIAAILIGSNDFVNANPQGGGGTTSETYVAIDSETFTVNATGDYYIYGNCFFYGTTTVSYTIKLIIDGVDYGETIVRPTSATFPNMQPYTFGMKVSLTAGSRTIGFYAKCNAAGGNVQLAFTSYGGLYLPDWPTHFFASALGAQVTNSTTYQDALSLTVTQNTSRCLVLATTQIARATATNNASISNWDGTTISESQNQTVFASTNNTYYGLSSGIPFNVSDRTLKIQWKRVASLLNNVTVINTTMLVLIPTSTLWIKGANILGAKLAVN